MTGEAFIIIIYLLMNIHNISANTSIHPSHHSTQVFFSIVFKFFTKGYKLASIS